ncbi:MAG: ATP-grasp domain-containing protein [Chloroflexi bacterium]|nr:ATP-grasp domain-containing protein [Chloroflexota bacterium]
MQNALSDNRIILLTSSLSYRARAFLEAARRLGLEVVQGLDMPPPLADYWQPTLPVDFKEPPRAAQDIFNFAAQKPVRAVIPVDDGATVIAALASELLDLSHNSSEAAYAARNKHRMRELLSAAGVPSPRFRPFQVGDDPATIAAEVNYPCVVKPLMLSASQGVIRANNPAEFEQAFRRTAGIVKASGGESDESHDCTHVLVEDFIPGFEVALEGILTEGRLKTLALFDKPDPLDGPFFEETIYVTPSRLPPPVQEAIFHCTAQACRALGLREGPVHAELRVNEQGPWVVEVAGRSIGGLCSNILRFGTSMSLEELILRQAVGMEIESLNREERAGGVMMIPIPGAGLLKCVEGLEQAQAVPGIEEIEITAKLDNRIMPLPEGSSYLGFIFARGETPQVVEAALREAHRHLRFTIVPEIYLARR